MENFPMQTLNQMSEAELLAWAIEFRNTSFTTTLGKRAAKTTGVAPVTITEKFGDFPAIANLKLSTYGGQRVFNDTVGGADTPTAEKVKGVREMIAQFKRGEVGRTRGEAVDPFMTIVMRVVRQAVKTKNEANYKNIMADRNRDNIFKAIFEKQRVGNTEKYRAIMAKATLLRKQQEEAAAITVDGMDADDL